MTFAIFEELRQHHQRENNNKETKGQGSTQKGVILDKMGSLVINTLVIIRWLP
jgi:hypothetical protein